MVHKILFHDKVFNIHIPVPVSRGLSLMNLSVAHIDRANPIVTGRCVDIGIPVVKKLNDVQVPSGDGTVDWS